jgi:acetyltransferase
MAEYPAHLERERRLADGHSVTIRPMRAADEPRVREFLAALSDENRYLRFQKFVPSLSERVMRYFTGVDHEYHVAFLAAVGAGAGERVVGDARYVVNPDRRSCEFAIVIADDWHKSGIAGLLMEVLIRVARSHGLQSMESIVLATNRPMLRFARQLGFAREATPDATVVRIVKKL